MNATILTQGDLSARLGETRGSARNLAGSAEVSRGHTKDGEPIRRAEHEGERGGFTIRGHGGAENP
jgi:hypothetical protein